MNNLQFHNMRDRQQPTGIEKYGTIWMNIAKLVAKASTAKRRQVGCAIVTKSMGVYTGYNGTIVGDDNVCEDAHDFSTLSSVFHAEDNALHKMSEEGIETEGSVVYITLSPCIVCANLLLNAGVSAVYYQDEYKCRLGIDLLRSNGVECTEFELTTKEGSIL